MDWGQSLKKGIKVGFSTVWALGKIIFPVTLMVSILQHTPLLPWLIKAVEPFMALLGLSGDAAIPLVLGNVLNLYAAIGAILSLDLTVKEVFILAVMLSFSHNLLVETSVATRVGVKIWIAIAVRVSLAIFSALLIRFIWQGGNEPVPFGFVSTTEEVTSNIFLYGMGTAINGIFQLAIIVIPLMIVIQILKDLKWLYVFSRWMAPVTRFLGMKENTSTTLAAGILFGLAFGAGVMIQAVKEDGVSKKDATLAFVFLAACHAIVEDTLIFVPLGIPVIPLFFIRLGAAILLTMVISRIWGRLEMIKGKETVYDY